MKLEGDQWRAPWGWEGEGGKAGDSPNPWYGIVPPAWLDIWCGKDEQQGAKVVDQVTNRLMNSVRRRLKGVGRFGLRRARCGGSESTQ